MLWSLWEKKERLLGEEANRKEMERKKKGARQLSG